MMAGMLTTALCLLVFASSTLIDFAHARCVVAIGDAAAHRASRWSVLQWGGATVGFLVAVKVTLWALPFEAAGLYLGTFLAVRRTAPPQQGVEARSLGADAPAPLRGRGDGERVRAGAGGTQRWPAGRAADDGVEPIRAGAQADLHDRQHDPQYDLQRREVPAAAGR